MYADFKNKYLRSIKIVDISETDINGVREYIYGCDVCDIYLFIQVDD